MTLLGYFTRSFDPCAYPFRFPNRKEVQMNIRPIQNTTYRLSLAGVLIALGVVLSFFYIPLGGAKLFPMQHLINVVGAVLLGPWYALLNAFLISLIRNMTGMGSLLAFPGSMIGALLAGLAFKKTGNYRLAALGELIGTGLIGGTVAAPFAVLLMGKEVGLFFFVIPFVASAFSGSLTALFLFETTALYQVVRHRSHSDQL